MSKPHLPVQSCRALLLRHGHNHKAAAPAKAQAICQSNTAALPHPSVEVSASATAPKMDGLLLRVLPSRAVSSCSRSVAHSSGGICGKQNKGGKRYKMHQRLAWRWSVSPASGTACPAPPAPQQAAPKRSLPQAAAALPHAVRRCTDPLATPAAAAVRTLPPLGPVMRKISRTGPSPLPVLMLAEETAMSSAVNMFVTWCGWGSERRQSGLGVLVAGRKLQHAFRGETATRLPWPHSTSTAAAHCSCAATVRWGGA